MCSMLMGVPGDKRSPGSPVPAQHLAHGTRRSLQRRSAAGTKGALVYRLGEMAGVLVLFVVVCTVGLSSPRLTGSGSRSIAPLLATLIAEDAASGTASR